MSEPIIIWQTDRHSIYKGILNTSLNLLLVQKIKYIELIYLLNTTTMAHFSTTLNLRKLTRLSVNDAILRSVYTSTLNKVNFEKYKDHIKNIGCITKKNPQLCQKWIDYQDNGPQSESWTWHNFKVPD